MQVQAWNDHSQSNKDKAEMEMARAQKLRELIFHLIEQTTNDLRVQVENTNFDFRKRIYEMRRAKEEAEYQMRTVLGFLHSGSPTIRAICILLGPPKRVFPRLRDSPFGPLGNHAT